MKFDMPSCGGCRTCEMVCSFRHKGAFAPSISSIKILEKEHSPGYIILLMEGGDGENIPCDGCKGLKVPFCIQFCKRREDLGKILNEFLEKKLSQ